MTSEIRTNSLKSRAGLSTVTFTDSGPMFSGITTFVDNSGFTFGVGAGSSIFTPATNTLTFGTNSNERLRIGSDGKVGIGTDNPDRIFHITTASPIIKLTDSDNSLSAEINGSSGNIYFDTHNSNRDIIFRGSTTEVARVTGDGKVGIGTNNPDEKLHVYNGAGNVTSFVEAIAGDAILDISNTGNGNYSGINFTRERSTGSVIGGSIFMPSNTNNNEAFLYIQTQSASANAGVTGALSDNNGVRLKLHGDDGIFSIETGSQERLRISSVGELTSTATQANVATFTSNQTASTIYVKDTDGDGIFISGSSAYGHRIYTNTTEDLLLGTNSTERLRITSGGLLQLNNDAAKIQLGASQDLSIYHDGSSNRIIAANADLILQSQNYAIRSENGSTTYLNIKSNGAIALPDGTQGIRFGSAASEDFAIFHSGSNSHIDHFGTGNLYHDFSNDFYMRFYQSAGVVRTALYVSNGGSGNPEFQLRSNPTSAPTNQGTSSPAVKLRGAGWNTSSGSVEVGTRLESVHSYWQSSFANVFGQTYPDFQIQYKNSDSGSYVAKVNIDGRAGMMMTSGGGAGFGFGNFSSRNYYARMTEYFGAAQDVGLNFWTTTNAGGSLVNHFRIDHNGDLKGTDTSISSISDSRVKKDVVDYTYDLSKFKLFTPKQFNWINPEMHGDKTNVKGFLAQDLEAIDTQWVGESFISKDDPDCELVDKSKNSIDEEVGVLKTSKFGDKDAMYISIIQQVLTKVETLEQENIALRVRVTNLEGE